MQFIRTIREVVPQVANGKTIVYMHGHGGFAWQTKGHIAMLRAQGYRLVVMDFRSPFRNHNSQDLITLMDEVDAELAHRKLLAKNTILVGISMGGLVALNLLRRHTILDKVLVITGGNIALRPSSRSLKKKWRITRDELERRWVDVNMHTADGKLRNKHIIMFLPMRDKVIDPEEVRREIARHAPHNDVTVIDTRGGHYRTIFTETVWRPQRSLELIAQLARL